MVAGRAVIVVGGVRLSSNGTTVTPSGSVAQHRDGRWESLPDEPFDPPLLDPGAVWTGKEVLIAGTPCAATSAEESKASCDATSIVAAALNPGTREWRVTEPPPALGDGHAPAVVHGLGWSGNEAVFEISEGGSTTLALYSPAKDSWRTATVRPHPQASILCFMAGDLYAANDQSEAHGNGAVSAAPTGEPVRTWRLETDDLRWTELEPFTPRLRDDPERGAATPVTCAGDHQLLFLTATHGELGPSWWFDPSITTWTEVASASGLRFQTSIAAGSVNGVHVLWPTPSDQISVSSARPGRWSTLDQPIADAGRPRSITPSVDGRLLVDVPVAGGASNYVLVDTGSRDSAR